MDKKVSVILPVYNGEKYVSEAIESVLNQTYQNIEFIIVNDCSTDGTNRIINRYAELDSRIKVINNKENLKLPKSLNRGFGEATGKYYTWTSADNKYKENAIQKMVSVLETEQYDMVYANFSNVDMEGKKINNVELPDVAYLWRGNVIGACFLYTKEIAAKVGEYDASLFLAEDYDYWVRIMDSGRIKHITDNLYWYRIHAESLTETKQEMVGMQTYKVWRKHFAFLYTLVLDEKDKYIFFDKMLEKCGKANESELKNYLCKIDKRYRIHIYYKNFKKKIDRMYGLLIKK